MNDIGSARVGRWLEGQVTASIRLPLDCIQSFRAIGENRIKSKKTRVILLRTDCRGAKH